MNDDKADDSTDFNRILRPLYIVLCLLIAMVVGGGIYGIVTTSSLRDNDRAIVSARDGARYRECVRDNNQLAKARARERESWLNYIFRANEFTKHEPTPAELAATEVFLKDQDDLVLDEFKDRAPRPCDKASLNDFYQRQAAAIR